jgi:hypothetical protein
VRLGNPNLAEAQEKSAAVRLAMPTLLLRTSCPSFEKSARPGLELRRTAAALDTRGIASRRGGPWTAQQVSDVLRREIGAKPKAQRPPNQMRRLCLSKGHRSARAGGSPLGLRGNCRRAGCHAKKGPHPGPWGFRQAGQGAAMRAPASRRHAFSYFCFEVGITHGRGFPRTL